MQSLPECESSQEIVPSMRCALQRCDPSDSGSQTADPLKNLIVVRVADGIPLADQGRLVLQSASASSLSVRSAPRSWSLALPSEAAGRRQGNQDRQTHYRCQALPCLGWLSLSCC